MKTNFILSLALISLLTPLSSFAKSLDSQREDFVEAYNILHKGGLFSGSHLKDYPLSIYLDYERIKQHLKITRDQALVNFIEANPDAFLSDKLRTELLIRFAKQERWTSLLKNYKDDQGGDT